MKIALDYEGALSDQTMAAVLIKELRRIGHEVGIINLRGSVLLGYNPVAPLEEWAALEMPLIDFYIIRDDDRTEKLWLAEALAKNNIYLYLKHPNADVMITPRSVL